MFKIKRIEFSIIEDYWTEVEHFHIPNKIVTKTVTQLGIYKSKYNMENQETQAYGLFDGNYMIGGTQIIEWDDSTIRWRANNIRESYRGDGLFYNLLSTIIANDWTNKTTLIGWFRSTAMWWPPIYDFQLYDGMRHEHDGDVYTMVKNSITNVCEDYNKRENKLYYE